MFLDPLGDRQIVLFDLLVHLSPHVLMNSEVLLHLKLAYLSLDRAYLGVELSAEGLDVFLILHAQLQGVLDPGEQVLVVALLRGL